MACWLFSCCCRGASADAGNCPTVPRFEEESCDCGAEMACSGKGHAAEFTPASAMSPDWEVRLSESPRPSDDEERRLEDFESGRVRAFDRRFVALCLAVIVVAMRVVTGGAVTIKNGSGG